MKSMNRFLSCTAAIAATFVVSSVFAQDECATAVTATAGVPAAFSTVTATPSANIPTDTLCAGTYLNWLVTQKDVWFKWTATETGQATFSTCDAASYDTSMALYLGSCANLVGCNGDGTGLAGCQAYYSLISNFNCTAGDVFYIRIGGYEDAVGAGNFTVSFVTGVPGCVGATGACNVAHGGLGCDNVNCCGSICPVNPLCCEVGWDAACVEMAIATCGYYSCPAVTGAPVNDCATNATVVPAFDSVQAFNTVNATTDGPDHPGASCSSGSDFFDKDVWWRVSPVANGAMTVSTCGSSSFDNKLAVYDMGTDPAAFDWDALAAALVFCNDDGPGGTCMTTEATPTSYASEATGNVQLGHTYLVRLGAYTIGEFGNGEARFTLPTPCQLGTPTGSESEPCGSAFNDGCNGAGETQPVSMGSTIAGTVWADANTRDTDFYSFSVSAGSQVTVSVKAARLVTVLLLAGDVSIAGCTGVSVITAGSGTCPTVSSYCLNAGTYYAFVGDAAFTGNPCGSGAFNDYTMEITSAPASCPILVSGGGATAGVCAAPGPNTMNSDPVMTTTQGLVACGVNPAAPNCSGGGTTANTYVRTFPAGTVSGDISCLSFGVFSVKRALNGATCASFYSDIPLPTTISIYRDLDGGAPRWVSADGGVDGNDLDLISSQDVLCAGGVYLATLNFAQPICVEEHAGYNIVVVMASPSLYDGLGAGVPAASGYGIRAAGNTPAGTTSSLTYFSAPGCGLGLTQFVLTESVGGSFLAHWVVQINGDNAAPCSAPACLGDYDGNGIRNGADLTTLLSNWGTPGADITGDGLTNGADLTTLLSGWGTCPQ
ncbi:MAG: hypothetical protein EXS15_06885 [Phycisphaerales bacterium]|nr:hypothetical protein [Phycisphaerales bacterium]